MASSWSVATTELSCPVCQDIFKDPVLLPCSHSFCNVCIQRWWRTRQTTSCPVCKAVSTQSVPPRNLVLKNLCEAFLLEVESGVICRQHTERLKLYCLDHQTPVCVVCRDSSQHRSHRFIPVDEAAQVHRKDLMKRLKPLREKTTLFHEVKAKLEKTDRDVKTQAEDTEKKIRLEFERLRAFLDQEENIRISALKQEETTKREMIKDKIADLSGVINSLESTINNVEGGLSDEDASFLLKVNTLQRETQRPLPDDPQPIAGALINVAKHRANIGFRVWCKMIENVSLNPITLNPNTAHEELHLSECLTSVRCGLRQDLPSTPERMQHHRCVLGVEGYSTGKHSWTVEVGQSEVWALGVISKKAQKTGDITSGLWIVRFCHGKFTAFSPSCPSSVLPLRDRFSPVRVHLDCDAGKLIFFDAQTDTVIHTFTHTFTSKMYPYINTWSVHPLKILPAKLSTVTHLLKRSMKENQ